MNDQYYILFPNQLNGIRLNGILESKNIRAVIAPTPRKFSASCGISLLVNGENIEEIKKIIEDYEIRVLDIIIND